MFNRDSVSGKCVIKLCHRPAVWCLSRARACAQMAGAGCSKRRADASTAAENLARTPGVDLAFAILATLPDLPVIFLPV